MAPRATPSVAEIMAPWADADSVPFPALAGRAGMPREVRRKILESGVIKPVPGTAGQGKMPMVTKEDAFLFAAAVVLAFIAGMAVVTVLRILAQTGAEFGGEVLRIPLPPGP
jgi:hypothetical protein